MEWKKMTAHQQAQTNRAMNKFGGSFVCALAMAWRLADAKNGEKLMGAFPEIVEAYGPETFAYETAVD